MSLPHLHLWFEKQRVHHYANGLNIVVSFNYAIDNEEKLKVSKVSLILPTIISKKKSVREVIAVIERRNE